MSADAGDTAGSGTSISDRSLLDSTLKIESSSETTKAGLCAGIADLGDPSLSEGSTIGAQTGSEASMSDLASSVGGSTPRLPAEDAKAKPAAPPALRIPVRARWCDISDGMITSLTVTESHEESLVGSPVGSPKKNSRKSTRRRRRREDAKAADGYDGEEAMGFGFDAADGGYASPMSAGPHGVVTLEDIGLDMSPSGRLAYGAAAAGEESPMSPSRRPAGGPMSMTSALALAGQWEGPCSPCHAQAGPGGLMSTRPCTAGRVPAACEASARIPGQDAVACAAVGPGPIMGTRPPCAVGHEASAHLPLATCASPVRASAGKQLRLPAAAMTSQWSSAVPEGQWPGSPCRMQGSPCGIVSTSPLSPTGVVINPTRTSAWSAAGSPTADALRSLFRGSGLPSNADLAAQLQAAVPDAYED